MDTTVVTTLVLVFVTGVIWKTVTWVCNGRNGRVSPSNGGTQEATQAHRRVQVVLANHKGGVGKSTIAFHLVWELALSQAKESRDEPVYAIDASRYGDLTKMLCGNEQARGSLNAAVRVSKQRWLCGTNDSAIRACAVRVRDVNPAAPPNLYVLSASALGDVEKDAKGDLRGAARALRTSLLQQRSVLVDTDGGELSALTQLGLMLSPQVVVPTLPCTVDVDRLRQLCEFLHHKREQRQLDQTPCFVACVFNKVRAARNEISTFGAVTPAKCVLSEMELVERQMLQLARDFPHLFPAELLEWDPESLHMRFFATVRSNEQVLIETRKGGFGLTDERAAQAVGNSKTLDGVRCDFRDLRSLLNRSAAA